MIDAVTVIPARGGSRRIPRKNIREFMGKPMLAHSIETALKVTPRVIVSTEDMEIAEVAQQYKAEVYQRPFWFARDDIGTQAVVKNVLDAYDYHMVKVVVVYPCAPLLVSDDLVHALALCTNNFVVAVGTQPLRDAGALYCGPAYMFRESAPLYDMQTRLLTLHESRVCDINQEFDWFDAEKKWKAMHE